MVSGGTIGTIAAGIVLLITFVIVEMRTAEPLIQIRMFAIRAFSVENVVLFWSMACFLPIFFFASVYAQARSASGPTRPGSTRCASSSDSRRVSR